MDGSEHHGKPEVYVELMRHVFLKLKESNSGEEGVDSLASCWAMLIF